MLGPNDIPPEVAAQQAERAQQNQVRERIRPVGEPSSSEAASTGKAQPESKPAGKKRRPSKLRAEKEAVSPEPHGRVAAEPTGSAQPGRESKRPLPPYLRVVK